MMRALLLEFPQDRNVRTIGTEYMLGEAVLVAPVFDQQEHAVYLPKGSWIDLEREARLDGGWIVKEKRIDEIPLFLRENRGLFRLAEAPMHIADENFREITFVIQCAIAAAENERVPIIIQFYPGLDKYIPLNIISYIAKDLARKASVPVAVHLDHSAGYEIAMSGIRDGFPSVMVDGSSLPFEENVSLTAQVVKAASVFGVDIEAELGHVGIGQNLEDMNSDLFTNVDQAVEFTFGSRGCVGCSREDGFFWMPAFRVPVRDTVGARDVFHGAFLEMLLKGMSPRECACRASGTSAIKCTFPDGRDGIPTEEILNHFLETGEILDETLCQRERFYERGIEYVRA